METNRTCAGGFMFPDEEQIAPSSSAVHHPAHYTKGGIETIDFIRAKLGAEGFRAYCLGNCYKYMTRHEHKNGLEDLKKAQVYLNWMVESYEESD